MASGGTERTGRSPAPPRCRFCAVKTGKGIFAKTRGLTAQLIQFQYTDAFYFYFAKPINEILSQTRSSEFLGFAEAVIESTRPKLQIAHYTSKDALGVLAKSASKHSLLANSLRRRNDRRPSIEMPNLTPHPFLLNPTGMLILRKGTSRKNAGNKRIEEDAKEKRRAAKCKEQMPLRDGDLLKGSRLFVDPESFETEMFDIYSPKFSSDEETSVLREATLEADLNTKNVEQSQPTITKRPWAWTLPHPKPSGDVGKIEIPLLKLGSKQLAWEAAKLGMKVNTFQSDNQSTQFSSSYNPQLQAKVRRKQVLEDLASKISPGFVAGIIEGQTFRSLATNPSVGGYSVLNPAGQIQNSTAPSLRPAARLDFSPKLNRKRQNKDKREKKGSDSDKDHRDHLERISRDPRARNLGKTSLLNSNSWQMAQSWDQFVAKPVSFGQNQYLQVEDHSNTAPQSARGVLGKSQETFKAFRPYGRNSSRKAGPSPEITTDRVPGLTSGSFRDKIGPFKSESQQICLTKRLRRPMWISVGQANGKNPTLKSKGPLMTSRTQDKSMQGLIAPASHSKGKSKERSEVGFTRGQNQVDEGQRSGNHHFLEIKPKKNKPQNKSMGKLAPTKVSTATTIQFGPSIPTRGAETSRAGPITFGSTVGNFPSNVNQKTQPQRLMMAARRMAAGAITSPHHSALVLSTSGPVPADCNNVSLFPHRLQTEGNKAGYMWPSQSFSKKKASKSRESHSFGHNLNSGGPFSHAIQFIPGLGILTAKKEVKKTSYSRSRSITKRGTATSSTGALANIQNGANLPIGLGYTADSRKRSQSKKQSSAYLSSRTRTD